SKSGFEELEASIVRAVSHELKNELRVTTAPTLKPGTESFTDLESQDVAILSTVFAFWPTQVGSISQWELERSLKRARYTGVGIALGIANLLDRRFIVERVVTEEDSNGDTYTAKHFQITPEGIAWIQAHKELLEVRSAEEDTDDIPF